MNSINEKEKKLNIALEELKNLDLTNPELQKNIENLSTKQNQLEIEKTQIEEKYKTLLEEHVPRVTFYIFLLSVFFQFLIDFVLCLNFRYFFVIQDLLDLNFLIPLMQYLIFFLFRL